MNNIIEFVTVMFMLSMIFERVSEFFKHYLSGRRIGRSHIVGDTTTKFPPGSLQEERRQYRILKMNLVIGFITAFLCHASLFDILHNIDNPGRVIGWPDKISPDDLTIDHWFDYIAFLLGCAFTGAFISLGSKFWHDMLDILVEIKDAKRALTVQKATPDFLSMDQEEQFQLLSDAVDENGSRWSTMFGNYAGVSIANKLKGEEKVNTGQLSLRFNVVKKENMPMDRVDRIPSFIYYKGFRLPTDVLETGKATAAAGKVIDPSIMPRPLGCSVGRDGTGRVGTLGLRVRLRVGGEEKICGVSCYHVLFPEELRNGIVSIQPDTRIIGTNELSSPVRGEASPQHHIGTVVRGEFNRFLDIAFFETNNEQIDNKVFEIGPIKGIYEVRPGDETAKTPVRIFGRTSGLCKGTILAASINKPIHYFEETDTPLVQEFQKLIQLDMKAAHGDSGAAVLTSSGALVGILVGIDGTYSYVLPANRLKANFPLRFDIQN